MGSRLRRGGAGPRRPRARRSRGNLETNGELAWGQGSTRPDRRAVCAAFSLTLPGSGATLGRFAAGPPLGIVRAVAVVSADDTAASTPPPRQPDAERATDSGRAHGPAPRNM